MTLVTKTGSVVPLLLKKIESITIEECGLKDVEKDPAGIEFCIHTVFWSPYIFNRELHLPSL